MKNIFRIPIVSGLILSVFLFSIYCCCFQDIVQAKPKVPPCHQAAQHTDQSHNNQECNCHKNILANDVVAVIDVGLFHVDIFNLDSVIAILSPVTLSLRSSYPESPPGVSSAVPLYIQNSVLRI
ncbi:MAG: hypothetical protein KBD53_09245 [Candidatus Omnitrophica bacterium]|nr:hypothetical protein [Candidatus Omnitrophota bacterium]